MIMGQTTYESVGGTWFVVVSSTDLAFVEAEINRLESHAMFIGPHKVDDIYVAKGMVIRAPLQ